MVFNRLVAASGNKGKIKELKELFRGVEIIPMREAGFTEEILENGNSFEENARIKATTVASALGVPAIADDSGLCVRALGGAPAIYSARYSGGGDKENRELLLKNLRGVSDRAAYFECAVCLCLPDGTVYFGSGRTYGEILKAECGDKGFGYDSVFFSHDLKKSFGEATDEEKNGVSHRARALSDLLSKL